MKQKTNTTQKAEPPALADGMDAAAENALMAQIEPPAHAGGSALNANVDALRAENEQLKASIRNTEAHRQITGELARAGARSPELLFNSVKGDVQFSTDGEIVNGAALIERLKTGFPEQFGFERSASSIDGGAGAAVLSPLTKEALAKMKPSEIAELDWADVRRVLAVK